jgi:hypothetical protein
VSSNLFDSPFIDTVLASQAAQESSRLTARASEAARRSTNASPVVKPAVKHVKVAAAPPRCLLFQGLILAPGGTALAMIHATPDNRCTPYSAGESCQGIVIGPMNADQVEITLKDGTTRKLARGCPFTIPEEVPHE